MDPLTLNVAGFSLTILEPLRRWRIVFNGILKQVYYIKNIIHLDLTSCALASCSQISVLYEVSPKYYIHMYIQPIQPLEVAFC